MLRPRTTPCKFPSAGMTHSTDSMTNHQLIRVDVYSKSGDIIETIMKPQWWLNLKDAAEEASKVSAL